MNQATLFDHVMRAVWDNQQEDEVSFIARAVADKLKGKARFDAENALAVVALVWSDATVQVRSPEPQANADGTLLFDVQFTDKSQVLVIADKYGRGNGVEWIG